jgi:hypothetical protein
MIRDLLPASVRLPLLNNRLKILKALLLRRPSLVTYACHVKASSSYVSMNRKQETSHDGAHNIP